MIALLYKVFFHLFNKTDFICYVYFNHSTLIRPAVGYLGSLEKEWVYCPLQEDVGLTLRHVCKSAYIGAQSSKMGRKPR